MEEKLVYLRKLGLTVEEASEVLYISTRQAYRYLRRVREREGD
jgi:DNA-directed RNA polymerase specialized sigma24 family protein